MMYQERRNIRMSARRADSRALKSKFGIVCKVDACTQTPTLGPMSAELSTRTGKPTLG